MNELKEGEAVAHGTASSIQYIPERIESCGFKIKIPEFIQLGICGELHHIDNRISSYPVSQSGNKYQKKQRGIEPQILPSLFSQ